MLVFRAEFKPKPIPNCSHAWHQPRAFALSSDWLICLSVFVVTGKGDYFGIDFRAVFNRVWKVISRLLCFCIATLYDWLKKFAPLSHPVRSKTKTNRDLLVSSRAWHRLHVFTLSANWFIGLSASLVIG